MRSLHIIQGGIENGDKEWLEGAARKPSISDPWTVPSSAVVGDDVVFYVGGFGFFATGRIASTPTPRPDWKNRYGAAIEAIKLVQPPILLPSIRKQLPQLGWARYPRSITTPTRDVSLLVRQLIRNPLTKGTLDLDDTAIGSVSLDALRAVCASMSRGKVATITERNVRVRVRSTYPRLIALKRASGRCEGCREPSPFRTATGPYLEAHHIDRLSDDGPDEPRNVIALCANCHRRAHFSVDAKAFNRFLQKQMTKLEPG